MSKTVMVVDDSDTIRKLVMFALRAQGLMVVTAQDGMDALEKLAEHPVDLVIADLNMPRLDGLALVQALRQDKDYADIPIIILSSLSGEDIKAQGLQIGANSYLVKPMDARRLQYEVAKYLN